MLCTTLFTALAALPQGGQGSSTAPVVINEFSYDDVGSDDFEFVELYNRSPVAVDLSNWSVVGDDSNGVNFTEVLPAGTVLPPGGFLVLGNTAVPNVNIVMAGGFLQNSAESITLYDDNQLLIDTLVYEANKGVWNPLLVEGEGVWGNFINVEGNDTSWSRFRDGFDSDNNGYDFRIQPWSPGASNNLPYQPLIVEVFDGVLVGDAVPGWGSSWYQPTVVDPTLIDANNPSAIPLSPQGANAAVLWDPAGGGDHGMLLAEPGKNVSFEAYVYIESAVTPVGESEMWSVGLGTSGSFFNFPDPTGVLGFEANGNTGISWTLVRDEFGANIYCIDHNDGGLGGNAIDTAITIGTVPITPGVNDGWQRLRIVINGGSVTARFGGTYGAGDGTAFTTSVDDVERGLYIGYRENLTVLTDARPFTWDLMTFTSEASALAAPYGVGCDNLTLTTTGAPTIGNSAFSLEVNNIGAVPIAFVGFGTAVVNPGLDLTLIGMAGCSGYTSLDLGIYQTGPVVAGTGSLPLPIPASSVFIGSKYSTQGLSFSPTTTLGLAASNGVSLSFGL